MKDGKGQKIKTEEKVGRMRADNDQRGEGQSSERKKDG